MIDGTGMGFVILLLIVIVIVLLIYMVNLNLRMNRLQRKYQLFMRGTDGQSVERAVTTRLNELGKLRFGQEKSREDLKELQHQYDNMLCKYGIVKYDAFEDVGGKMSFALAMLDQNNTGFVLNAIHSRDNCYLYLKDVVKGTSYIMLSDEEVEALRRASRFGEAEVAAAATRRQKRDEDRARRAAAEEAKTAKKLAAQARKTQAVPETEEEAELRRLEQIISDAESKIRAEAPAEAPPKAPAAGPAAAPAKATVKAPANVSAEAPAEFPSEAIAEIPAE